MEETTTKKNFIGTNNDKLVLPLANLVFETEGYKAIYPEIHEVHASPSIFCYYAG